MCTKKHFSFSFSLYEFENSINKYQISYQILMRHRIGSVNRNFISNVGKTGLPGPLFEVDN